MGTKASPEALHTYYNTRDHSGKLAPDVRFRHSRKNNLADPDPYIGKYNNPVNYDPDDRTTYETIVDALQSPTLLEDFRGTFDRFVEYFRSEAVDARETVERITEKRRKQLLKEGKVYTDMLANQSAIAAFRLLDTSMHYVKSAMTQGPLRYVDHETDELSFDPLDGYYKIDQPIVDKNGNEYDGLVGLFKTLIDPETGKSYEKTAYQYLVAKRIVQLHEAGDPAAERTPGGMTKEQAESYIADIDGDPSYSHVIDFANGYRAWNDALIDFAVGTGILPAEEADAWKAKAYVPFYRDHWRDDFDALKKYASRKRDRASISAGTIEEKLEGSNDAIDEDLISAIVANAEGVIQDGMRNVAHARLARDLGELGLAKPAEKSDVNVIAYYENGEKKFVEVDDPLLWQAALTGGENVVTGIWRWLGPKPAALLRESVTRSPPFLVRNLFRDTMSAFVTSGADFTPVIDTMKKFNKKDFELARKLGIAMEPDFINDRSRYRSQVQRLIKPEESDVKSVFYKVWDTMGDWSRMSDAATRMAVYEDVLQRTGNEAEAIYQAMEVINFGRRGRNPLWRAVLSSVPFLNARIQGLDVIARSFTGRYTANPEMQSDPNQVRNTMVMRGLFLGAMTGLYYALVGDEEWYKNQRDEVKDDYWLIPVGNGVLASVPVPFEVGLIYKTIPEQFMRRATEEGYTAERHLESLKRAGLQAANFRPTPQLLAPAIDALRNRNSFSGEPIVPTYMMEAFESTEQRDINTNEMAVVVGEVLGASPMKIEYLINGYLGPLGGYVAMVADKVARMDAARSVVEGATWADLPENPGSSAGTRQDMTSLRSAPVLRQLFREAGAGGGYQQQFYALRANVDRAVAKINKAANERRIEDLQAARHEEAAIMGVRPMVNRLDRYMQNWRERRDQVLMNKGLTDEDKRKRIELLEEERDRQLAIVPFLTEISEGRNP